MKDYSITTDVSRMDSKRIHQYLANESYWAAGIPLAVVERAMRNSICFAVLGPDDGLAGFARVVTDRATFAYLADVFILTPHRGQGLSKRLIDAILDHPDLQDLRRWLLATRDAHGLYSERAGFQPLSAPERWMERHNPNVYTDRPWMS